MVCPVLGSFYLRLLVAGMTGMHCCGFVLRSYMFWTPSIISYPYPGVSPDFWFITAQPRDATMLVKLVNGTLCLKVSVNVDQTNDLGFCHQW
jgi:hypothetical protein